MHSKSTHWDLWIRCREAWLNNQAPQSRRAYRKDWEQFFDFCTLPPWEVSEHQAHAWVQHLKHTYKAATINRKISALASFYRFAANYNL